MGLFIVVKRRYLMWTWMTLPSRGCLCFGRIGCATLILAWSRTAVLLLILVRCRLVHAVYMRYNGTWQTRANLCLDLGNNLLVLDINHIDQTHWRLLPTLCIFWILALVLLSLLIWNELVGKEISLRLTHTNDIIGRPRLLVDFIWIGRITVQVHPCT